MAIQVETKDCTALTDTDLDEMASMGGAFGIGDAVQGQGGLGPRHAGQDRREAATGSPSRPSSASAARPACSSACSA